MLSLQILQVLMLAVVDRLSLQALMLVEVYMLNLQNLQVLM